MSQLHYGGEIICYQVRRLARATRKLTIKVHPDGQVEVLAPQTASVGVSTSKFVRNEGEVIRHNFGWTLVLLVYLIVIGVGFYFINPAAINLH